MARVRALHLRPYIAAHLVAGGGRHQINRHMLGLFHSRPGARAWRRVLSEAAGDDAAGLVPYNTALAEVLRAADAAGQANEA